MKIANPSATVIAYSQLVPQTETRYSADETRKIIAADPCSELSRITEICGRVSWKSEGKMGPGTADGFCVRVVNVRRDQSIAEHACVTMRLVTDRYTSHQVVRHRISAYTQESTHYINYSKPEQGGELTFMEPLGIKKHVPGPCSACSAGDTEMAHHDHDHDWWGLTPEYRDWMEHCERSERLYLDLIKRGVHHKNARHVLPGCLKTELVCTWNLRMWLHVLKERTSPNNTPEIIHVMKLAAANMVGLCPEIFGEYYSADGSAKTAVKP